MTPTTFKVQPEFQVGQLVWHRGNRDACGVIDSIVLNGRDDFRYRVSWGSIDFSEERETTLTDERPTEFGAGESGDNKADNRAKVGCPQTSPLSYLPSERATPGARWR